MASQQTAVKRESRAWWGAGVQPREAAAVAGILLLQVLVFSVSWSSFFCGDSIFYLARVLEPAKVRFLFTHYDAQGAYRPLTYVVFTWLLYPLCGLRPLPYHLAASAFAALNSLLFCALLRRVLSARAALIALFLFAIHAVQFYPFYDITFLPDLMMMFCWLMALLAYSHYARRRNWLAYAASLLWFTAGFLSKETTLMLPVSIAAWHWLVARSPKSEVQSPKSAEVKRLVLSVLPFLIGAALFLRWTMYVKHGLLYPGGIYGFTLRPADLWPKLAYFAWLANLPDQPWLAGVSGWLAAALALPAMAWACWKFACAWWPAKWELLACAAWAASAVAPLIVVTQAPMEHNLYIPLAALSLALGIAFDQSPRSKVQSPKSETVGMPVESCTAVPGVPPSRDAAPRFVPLARGRIDVRRFIRRAALPVMALLLVVSVSLQARYNARESWVGQGSRITRDALDSMRRYYPALPAGAIVYLLPTTVEGNVAWYFDGGGLFQVFYRDPALRMLFADAGHKLPFDFATRSGVFILRFADNRLLDVTADYKMGHLPAVSHRLLEEFDQAAISVDRSEPYANFERFDTPTGQVAFLHTVQAGVTGSQAPRPALVTLAGARVAFPLADFGAGKRLLISIAPALGVGDGMEARVVLQSAGKRELVFSHYVRPGDGWYDASIPLTALNGASGGLLLECSSGPARDVTGDWLAWSRLLIVR